LRVCNATQDQFSPKLVADGTDGAILTWSDARHGVSNFDVYAQRIDGTGTPQWPTNGVALCDVANNQLNPTISSDGAGGAIAVWEDYRIGSVGNIDLYAQHVDATGTAQWTPNGVALCTAAGDQHYPTIATDGAGGAIVVWQDGRLLAQRV